METINSLPPGFRFHPTDEELISYYLKNKLSESSMINPMVSLIAEVDLYKFNPWELPEKASFGESEWFFYSPRDRKYPNGVRPNRTAASGYWKATGTDKPILSSYASQCVGVKKALVFYKGRPPKGMKTNWMMDEYRLLTHNNHSLKHKGSMRLDDWVLCRVRHKNSAGEQWSSSNGNNSTTSSPTSVNYQEGFNETEMTESFDYLTDYGYASQGGDQVLHGNGLLDFEAGGSSTSLIPNVNSIPPPDTDHSVKDALESIKRALSLGALDEQMSSKMPNKRQCSIGYSGYLDQATAGIFEISSI